jgi:uncharacterized protein (TIGR03083 family)
VTDARWDLIADERRALADLLDTLTPAQAAAPSLCGEWTVKDVAAHVMVGPTSSMPEVLLAMLRGRMSFHRANRILVDNRSGQSLAELAEVMRAKAGSRFTPPMMDWHAPLTDTLIHREDIAVPLGFASDRPVESWRLALEFQLSKKADGIFGPRGRPEVTLVASDLDWRHGSGPEVRGPVAALALAVAGRTARLDALDGPGVVLVREWLAAQ